VTNDELIGKDLVGSRRGLILRYYSSIRQKGLRKTTQKSITIADGQGREFNTGPPEYKAGVLTIPIPCSVGILWIVN
jgi:hypothetical protein